MIQRYVIREDYHENKISDYFGPCVLLFYTRRPGRYPALGFKGPSRLCSGLFPYLYRQQGNPYLLAVTLSIRNVSPATPITVTEVSYHDTQGQLLKIFKNPVPLNTLASTRHIIHRDDKDGGDGACFIVKWEAKEKTNPPIIETVMIGTQSQQGISFTSRGEVILEKE